MLLDLIRAANRRHLHLHLGHMTVPFEWYLTDVELLWFESEDRARPKRCTRYTVSANPLLGFKCYFPLTAHLDYCTGVLCEVSPALKLWQHIIHTLAQLHRALSTKSSLWPTNPPCPGPAHYLMYLLHPYTPSRELQSSGSGFLSKIHTRLLLSKLVK